MSSFVEHCSWSAFWWSAGFSRFPRSFLDSRILALRANAEYNSAPRSSRCALQSVTG